MQEKGDSRRGRRCVEQALDEMAREKYCMLFMQHVFLCIYREHAYDREN